MAEWDEEEESTLPVLPEEHFVRVVYNGREYHQLSLSSNAYLAPIDEVEVERLQMTHDMFSLVFDDRLIFPEITPLRRVLDCGTGTANWAVEVARREPQSQVYGVDVSTEMMPMYGYYPVNLHLEQADLNEGLAYHDNTFDLVHSRLVAGGIDAEKWPEYIRDLHRVLVPGGWVQMVEIYFNAQSDGGHLSDNHALSHWSRHYLSAMESAGKDPRAGLKLDHWMREAGFTRMEMREITLPMCGWSHNERDFGIGVANQENVSRLLSSLALYPCTAIQDMTIEEFHLLVGQARQEAAALGLKPYFKAYVVVGMKRAGAVSHRHSSSKSSSSRHRKGRNGKRVPR
ncbi:S-adenosyl-L-methionine-dependent methyltransferase [Apiospora arundinis]|uniref:S-adenosyl-L-methionine-dependent methyltransferase n=1 Tax=Apiospora arundinis TaxID=335852 RepID=A0ABR2IVK8_9PEZI